MKGSGILIIALLLYYLSPAQVGVSSIAYVMDQHPKKMENYFQKKGFKKEGYAFTREPFFSKQSIEDSINISRFIQVQYENENLELVYKTSSLLEQQDWKKELSSISLSFSGNENGSLFFDPKNRITFEFSEAMEDSLRLYILTATRTQLPRIRDLIFAEDLLSINAHVYLENIFGAQNVKEEYFHFSQSLRKKCSVIFPNTSRQAIFLWNDEENKKDLSFIIIGEYESQATGGNSPLTLAQWKSQQGISCGMSLREVELLNQKAFNFYRWRSPQSGTLASHNSGELDFARIEIVLDCMNCSFVSGKSDSMTISSSEAAQLNQKWYVRSFAVIRQSPARE